MKIVIIGGRDQADFLIGSLLAKKHSLSVINEDKTYSEYLSETHNISVLNGDPCKLYILDQAHIKNFDVLIALTPNDADNLAICQTAKRLYNIKKAVCTVVNPKNVEVFKKLGVNTVISATYMIAKFIEQASTIENLIKTLSIEDEKMILSEVVVDENFYCSDKKIAELSFPQNTIISCVIRGSEMIVPNGATVLKPGDKLLIISTPETQSAAVCAIQEASGKELKRSAK